MPAFKVYALAIFAIMIASSTAFHERLGAPLAHSTLPFQPNNVASGLQQALDWLKVQDPTNGSYGNYYEHWTAAAALALWANDSNSAEAARSYAYLAGQLNSPSFWGTIGEADVPGAVLYSIASSLNLGLINSSFVASELAQFQQSNGGFSGYYDFNQGQTVTSSVDSDMAVLGLTAASLDSSTIPFAAQYLLTLQNPDGSFNLTSTVRYDAIYSLGPDSVSITALTLLALNSAGYTIADSGVIEGLQFLSAAAPTSRCITGRVYSAALAALAFQTFHENYRALENVFYILSQQSQDGGFSEVSRSSYPRSNALDTGWASLALEQSLQIQGVNYQPSNCPPVAAFTISPETIVVGQSVQFNASTSIDVDGDQLSYNWTFGDGSSGEGESFSHVYAQSGNFTVTLTVRDSGTDPGPLSDARSMTVQVRPGTVQKSPGLTLSRGGLLVLAGVGGAAIVLLVGAAFYLGRKSVKASRFSDSG
ncbi:PKD domain-containing protein [Candidatus Bathyarchaeota archaeon]|nr:PKD domain-containing protein [Candidatus Bathyarchaeota archaeon]